MKVVAVLVVLVVGGVIFLNFKGSSGEKKLSPTEQGKIAHSEAEGCANWTEVLDRAGEPRKWRDDSSNFDFIYRDRFDETTRDNIAKKIEAGELGNGFSFLYKYSNAVTFAVNFDSKGNFNNIQDKEGQSAIMDEAGG